MSNEEEVKLDGDIIKTIYNDPKYVYGWSSDDPPIGDGGAVKIKSEDYANLKQLKTDPTKLRKKEYYLKNKDRLKAQNKEWRQKNRETINKKSNQYYHSHAEKSKEYLVKSRDRLKQEVFGHYTEGNKIKCFICGEDHMECLTIDHIDGKKSDINRSAIRKNLYFWLKKNNYPDGFRVICSNCNLKRMAQDVERK